MKVPQESSPVTVPSGEKEGEGQRVCRLGALGTLVWDRILHRDIRREPVLEWGGLSYALEALSVALPEGWVARPILKVGEDLADRAVDYLRTLPRMELEPGVRVVPFPNPRVELRYEKQVRKLERLEGGVPPWSWDELEPVLEGLDALYVNFITGFELSLETARHFRERCPIPLYADLHSLFQGISSLGYRFPRELPRWGAWFRAFDAIQVNEGEFALMAHSWGDPWTLAADTVGPELKLIAVTMGPRGSAYVSAPDFHPDPGRWPRIRSALSGGGTTRTGKVALRDPSTSGDPTGCGDVWGATFFASLLRGDSLEEAMTRANRLAAENVERRGARGLGLHLGKAPGP